MRVAGATRQIQTRLDLVARDDVMKVMTTRNARESIERSRRGNEAERVRAMATSASLPRRLRCLWLALAVSFALAGCAAAPEPMVENDIDAFTVGIDQVLKIGMSIREARAALRARLPPPSMNTEVSPPVPTPNASKRMKRYMLGWPTLTHGTTFVVTIFCDGSGKVVRWTVGPLTES
jgi:hypothetical protein